MSSPRILAVIVNYNSGHWIDEAVESLRAQSVPVDILVVDNQSSDGSLERLQARFENLLLVRNGGNFGYPQANNVALRYEGYEYYLLFNSDANAEPTAVERLLGLMDRHPELGGLGATLVEYHAPSTIQHFQPRFDPLCFPVDVWEGLAVDALPTSELVETGYLCTAAAMFRATAYRDVGGMDADFFLVTEDTDLSWRLRLRGWRLAVTPLVRVRHVGGGSAPYGQRNGAYETSEMRLYQRERNCIFMALKCYAWWMLLPYALTNVLAMLAESAMLALLGKRRLAAINLRVLRDAARSLGAVLSRRHHVQSTRKVGEREVLATLYWGIGKLWKLRRDGIPALRTASSSRPSA